MIILLMSILTVLPRAHAQEKSVVPTVPAFIQKTDRKTGQRSQLSLAFLHDPQLTTSSGKVPGRFSNLSLSFLTAHTIIHTFKPHYLKKQPLDSYSREFLEFLAPYNSLFAPRKAHALLVRAIQHNQLNEKFLSDLFTLNHDLSINECDGYGRPIHYAANNPYLIRLCMDHGADINSGTFKEGLTPVMLAIDNDNSKALQTLLSYAPNLEIKNYYKETALAYAARFNRNDMVQLLLKEGANINVQDREGYTPLSYAILKNDISTINQMLRITNVDTSLATKNRYTPLHLAVTMPFESTSLIEHLLLAKPPLEARTNNEETAFGLAVKNNYKNSMCLLKKAGANIHCASITQAEKKLTPLQYSATDHGLTRFLLSLGCDPSYPHQPYKYSPLEIAAYWSKWDTVRLLVQHDAQLRPNLSAVSIDRILQCPDYELLQRLLGQIATIPSTLSEPSHFWISVARSNNIRLVELLLDKGLHVQFFTDSACVTALFQNASPALKQFLATYRPPWYQQLPLYKKMLIDTQTFLKDGITKNPKTVSFLFFSSLLALWGIKHSRK